MSLFDLIRYPIGDIYNEAQLSHVPQFILDTWVELCIADAGLYDTMYRGLRTGSIIRLCVKQRVRDHNLRSMQTSDILTMSEVKEKYTKMLCELVYENEYYED